MKKIESKNEQKTEIVTVKLQCLCIACGKYINPGEKASQTSGYKDGRFFSIRKHESC